MNLLYKLKKGSLIKDTFIYTITDTIGRAIGFLLLPFVSFYMPPDELGIATNFSVLTSIIILLSGEALVNSIPYFYYEQTKKENSVLVTNLLLLCILVSLFLLLLVCGCQRLLLNYVKIDFDFQLLAILYVVFQLFNNTNLILLRLENRPKQFAFLQIVQILLHLIFVILFIIVYRWEGRGKILSEVLPAILLFFINFYLLLKKGYLIPIIDKKCIIKLIKFGLPLLPHSLSFWFKGGMDKVFITTYCGLYQNGLYSMALTITSIYTIVKNAFFKAYVPYLQKKLSNINAENELEEKRKIVILTYSLCAVFFVVAVITVFMGWIILNYIVDEKYIDSFKFLPWLILGLYIYAIYSFSIEFIYKMKKTLIMGIITFTGSIIQMLLSFFLIKNIGIMGAIYSSIIGTAIISISIFIYSNKVYPMPWFHLKHN
ncbi:MAG: oligosaccharide flippase family protein [Prevotella sp.]|nr:oligosaccharide flippase family protein [Prevotella sp.]